ncbi:MAG: general secretion pathway protein GspK [Verrucomicrobiota bacterium]
MKIRLKKSAKEGIALVIVMLVILVLASLAAIFASSMKVETTLARHENFESEFEWVGRSGVELARFVISEQAKIPNEGNYEALNQKWAGGVGGAAASNSPISEISLENNQLGNGTFSVKITDLERKFNINMSDQSVLQQALTVMGVDASLTPTITDSVLDWLDKDEDTHLSGAESDYYLSLDSPYLCKNGPMGDISELLLIKGVRDNPAIYWGSSNTNHPVSAFQARSTSRPFADQNEPSYPIGLVDIFTPLSSGKININTASQSSLQMIPGVDEGIAAGIVQLRAGPDGVEGTEDDTPLRSIGELANVPGMSRAVVQQLSPYCDVRSQTFEVEVTVQLNGVSRQYYAVLRRSSTVGPFPMLKFYWK